MNTSDMNTSVFSVKDLYYLLFRHKMIILICALLGVVASVMVFFLTPSYYTSEARLFIRYITETTPLDPAVAGAEKISTMPRGGNVIASEIEILTSPDLAAQVMEKIGERRLSGQGDAAGKREAPGWTRRMRARIAGVNPAQLNATTNTPSGQGVSLKILANLRVDVPKNSNIIRLYYNGSSPELARDVLQALVDSYLRKHVEIHRTAGAFEFLAQQTDQLRVRLNKTEEEVTRGG